MDYLKIVESELQQCRYKYPMPESVYKIASSARCPGRERPFRQDRTSQTTKAMTMLTEVTKNRFDSQFFDTSSSVGRGGSEYRQQNETAQAHQYNKHRHRIRNVVAIRVSGFPYYKRTCDRVKGGMGGVHRVVSGNVL